jgi:hypothetical protein
MEVVDTNAERMTSGRARAPSYGFGIDGLLWCGVYFDKTFARRAD